MSLLKHSTVIFFVGTGGKAPCFPNLDTTLDGGKWPTSGSGCYTHGRSAHGAHTMEFLMTNIKL